MIQQKRTGGDVRSVDDSDVSRGVDETLDDTIMAADDTNLESGNTSSADLARRGIKEKASKRLDKSAPRARAVALNSLAGVQMLIMEAQELRIACPELERLQEMATRAQRWRLAAREALDESRECTEVQLDSLLTELEGLPLRLQARGLLQRKLSRKRWLLCRRQQLATALEGVPRQSYLREMADEATDLGLEEIPEVQVAKERLRDAEQWIVKASEALSLEADLGVLKELRQSAASLGVQFEMLETVEQRIRDSQDWASRAMGALESPTSLEEIRSLLAQAERAAVPLAQRAQLIEREATAVWWQNRAANVFLKQGCQVTLLEALQGDGHFDLVGEDGAWSASLACSYCTGEDASETSQFMIGCDTCGRWYHGPCVGVGKAAADAMDVFLCPECACRQLKAYAFGPPLPVPKRTRRPSIRLVKALLQEAAELGITIPEAALIADALQKAELWQAAARQILHDLEGERAVLSEVQAFVRQGTELEVVPDLLAPLKRHLSRHEDWSEAVAELRVAPQEQKRGAALATAAWDGLDGALCLRSQASLLRVAEDHAAALITALDVGPTWQAAARAALSMSGREAAAEMQRLLSTVDVHVSPEFEQLRLALARQELLPVPDAFDQHTGLVHGLSD